MQPGDGVLTPFACQILCVRACVRACWGRGRGVGRCCLCSCAWLCEGVFVHRIVGEAGWGSTHCERRHLVRMRLELPATTTAASGRADASRAALDCVRPYTTGEGSIASLTVLRHCCPPGPLSVCLAACKAHALRRSMRYYRTQRALAHVRMALAHAARATTRAHGRTLRGSSGCLRCATNACSRSRCSYALISIGSASATASASSEAHALASRSDGALSSPSDASRCARNVQPRVQHKDRCSNTTQRTRAGSVMIMLCKCGVML